MKEMQEGMLNTEFSMYPGSKHSEIMDQLVLAFREDNGFRARKLSEELIEVGLTNELNDELQEWRFHLIGELAVIMTLYKERGPLSDRLYQDSRHFYRRIAATGSVAELQLLSIEMAASFCRRDDREFGNYSVLVRSIIDMTDQDLTEALTLQYFAEKLNVNSSYLSNLFRKETGVTITDYVTSKRINLAKILLRHSQSSVRTVAKQVGIPDVQYFSRLFKKRTGMTPSQYRTGEEQDVSREVENTKDE